MKKDLIKKLVLPLSYVIMGILFCIFKSVVSEWICRVIGIIITLYGSINLVQDLKNKNANLYLTGDVVTIGFGALIIVLSFVIVTVINILLGVVFIIYGGYKIAFGQMVGKISKSALIIALIDGALYLVIGILLIINSDSIYIILGVILMVAGIIDLIQIMSAKGPFNERKTSSKDVLDVEVKVIDEEEK